MRYLNAHLSTFEFILSVRVEGGEEGEVGPINVLPIVGVAIQCNNAGFEIGLDSDLGLGVAAPGARFLV